MQAAEGKDDDPLSIVVVELTPDVVPCVTVVRAPEASSYTISKPSIQAPENTVICETRLIRSCRPTFPD